MTNKPKQSEKDPSSDAPQDEQPEEATQDTPDQAPQDENETDHTEEAAAQTKEDKEKQVNEELRNIYQENDGKMPDLSKLDQRAHNPLTRFLIGTIVVLTILALAAWAGFLFWTETLAPTKTPLEVTIEGPRSAQGGETVFYHVQYKNDGDVGFRTMNIELNLPDQFQIHNTIPESTNGNRWELGALSAGSDGQLTVEGTFRAPVPSNQTIQAFITYQPENFSSDFQRVESKTITINQSVLETTIDGPEKAVIGDETTYELQVENTGSDEQRDMRTRVTLPESFTINRMEPEPADADTTAWDIETLGPGEIKTYTIHGNYTSSAEGTQTVKVESGFINDDIFAQQSDHTMFTDILGGDFNMHLIVGGNSESQTADLGETLRISLDYENSGQEVIETEGLTLRLVPDQDKTLPIDWESASLADGEREGNGIHWDIETIEALGALQPGETGVIDISLPVMTEIDLETVADSFTMSAQTTLSKIGSVESARTVETTPVNVAIDSDVRPAVGARYYNEEGQPLGSGPMPPTVDETTQFQIVWTVQNSLHALEDVTFSTNLPPNVTWRDNTNADIGTVSFDETTRLVTWRIERLPLEMNEATVTFDVSITPTESDVGTFVKLTNATSIDAIDEKTGGRIATARDIVTTELRGDTHADGLGVVVDAEE